MNAPLSLIPPNEHNRQKLIGSSDVAGIFGISPWRTPLDVYLEKVEPRVESIDPGKAQVLARGKRMEPYVIDILAEETGLEITQRGNRYRDPELDFIGAEIDAEAASGENIEIKTVSPFKAKAWGEEHTDAIPVYYTAQAMHGLMVTGRDVCVFGVLIGGDDFRIYRVERDEETIAAIRQREIDFWQRVINRQPPEPINTADVLRTFERDSGRSIEASPELADCIARMHALQAQIKPLTEEFNQLKEQIQLSMGDAAILACGNAMLATWKTQTTRRFDQQAFALAHPDLLDQFKRTSQNRVFRLH